MPLLEPLRLFFFIIALLLDCEKVNSATSNWEWQRAVISVKIDSTASVSGAAMERETIRLAGFYAPKTSLTAFQSGGKLVKVLSLGLCRDETDQLHHEAWIGLVYPKESDWYAPSTCNRLAEQVLRAARRGAVGLVFDLRNAHGLLRDQLMEISTADQERFNITVTIVDSREAKNLDLLESLDLAKYHAQVDIMPAKANARVSGRTGGVIGGHQRTRATFYAEIAAFLLFFFVFCITGIALLLKFYSKRDTSATSTTSISLLTANKLTRSIVDQLETRLYKPSFERSDSNAREAASCPVCLIEFHSKEPIRVLPCRHQLHLSCADHWLVDNQTCPMCQHNILGEPPTKAGDNNTTETMTTTATTRITGLVVNATGPCDDSSSSYSALCDEGSSTVTTSGTGSKPLEAIGRKPSSKETTL